MDARIWWQLVTIQYLEGNFRAFNPDRIAQNILEKVIRSHIHKVEVSHLADLNDPKRALPRKAKLYTKNQISDKFILILEGRAIVTIGQKEMIFEVGPWHCFGKEILDQLDQLIDMVEQQQKSAATTGTNSGSTIQTSTIRTVTSASNAIDKIDGTGNRISHGTLPGIHPSISVNVQQQPLVDLIGPDAAKKVKFTPDYSVNILSECTYLEISVQTYLAMYRSTFITRNKEGVDIVPTVNSINLPFEANAIATSNTPITTPQHNSKEQNGDKKASDDDNLVDNTPVMEEGATELAAKSFVDANEKLTTLEKVHPLKVTGNGAISGNPKRKRMDDSRHRRTNSDTLTGLLSNGTRSAEADERNCAEDDQIDLELGHKNEGKILTFK